VPAENFPSAFNKRTKKLKRKLRKAGIKSWSLPLLDFIFRGFNMEDSLVGSLDPKKTTLRQAIVLATDLAEFNDTFYNNINIVYDGPIPPGLEGYPKDGAAPGYTRGPDLEKAKAKLVEAGYPEGKGLPQIEYWTSQGGNNAEQAELTQRQLGKIGIKVKVHLVDFSQLIEAVNNKKTQIFGFAWGSDYPDAENNLALFYSPNKAPGSNHYNYNNPKFDPLYEQIRGMPPGPARTALYVQMRDIVLADAPYIGSMARTRFYVANPWLINFLPSEMFYNWVKYLDVDDSKRTNK
jgi:oligopeptide transport system substrate-binding protein